MIYGEFHIKREQDTTDRVGIRTLVLSQKWQPSTWPLADPELDQQKPGIPAVSDAMMLMGVEHRDAGHAFRTFWTFEGIPGDGKSVTFKDRNTSFDYGFQPGFEQTDIRKHPKIQELLERYGGVIDPSSLEIVWPITIGGDTGSKSGFGKRSEGGGGETPNPMFGRNEFFQATGTYTHRYVDRNPPRAVPRGRVLKNSGLPGRPPQDIGDCDWLYGGAPYRCLGLIYDITEIYFLSGAGGWPEPIYNLIAGGSGGTRPGVNALDGRSFT